LFRSAGWWAYEICHNKHVRQFHEDPEKKTPSVHYMLGLANAATTNDGSAADGNDGIDSVSHATEDDDAGGVDASGVRYWSQWYGGGTVCDLTGQPRRTEVRYVCEPNKPEHVADVRETATCQYQALVATPRLCKHPAFRPREGSALPILCQQIVDDATWDAYRRRPDTFIHSPPPVRP
jgi:hypothetical protein